MSLAGGISRVIVESLGDSLLPSRQPVKSCVKVRTEPPSRVFPLCAVACVSSRSIQQSGDVMSLTNYAEEPRINPLDVVERLATGNDWSFERASDDEITILVTGRWTDYQLSYTWMSDIEALHLACAF